MIKHDFQKFKTIRSFAREIYNGITLNDMMCLKNK